MQISVKSFVHFEAMVIDDRFPNKIDKAILILTGLKVW